MEKVQKEKFQLFQNKTLKLSIRAIQNCDGSISINAEDTAIGFGWYEEKNGKVYPRWRIINSYLRELNFSQEVAKDDYIPESLFYLLGMKASNQRAVEFQKWLAIDVIPTIRKTGSYVHEKNNNQLSFFDNTDLENYSVVAENANAMKVALDTSKLFNKMIDENKLSKILKLTIAQELFKNIGIDIDLNKKSQSGKISLVEKYKCQDQVKKLLSEGFTYQQVSDELEKSNIKIGKNSIARYALKNNLNGYYYKGGNADD